MHFCHPVNYETHASVLNPSPLQWHCSGCCTPTTHWRAKARQQTPVVAFPKCGFRKWRQKTANEARLDWLGLVVPGYTITCLIVVSGIGQWFCVINIRGTSYIKCFRNNWNIHMSRVEPNKREKMSHKYEENNNSTVQKKNMVALGWVVKCHNSGTVYT